jgi:hypothetical protein
VGKRPLGKTRHGWVDDVKVDLVEIGWDGVDWVGLAQDKDNWIAFVSAAMNLRVQVWVHELFVGIV